MPNILRSYNIGLTVKPRVWYSFKGDGFQALDDEVMSRIQDSAVDEESGDEEELTTTQETQAAFQHVLLDSQATQGAEAASFSSNLEL